MADYISESGREQLSFVARLGLLVAEAVLLDAALPSHKDSPSVYTPAGAAIHSVKNLTASIHNANHLWEKKGRVSPLDWLSSAECLMMAWKRGGAAEMRRVSMEQTRRFSARQKQEKTDDWRQRD